MSLSSRTFGQAMKPLLSTAEVAIKRNSKQSVTAFSSLVGKVPDQTQSQTRKQHTSVASQQINFPYDMVMPPAGSFSLDALHQKPARGIAEKLHAIIESMPFVHGTAPTSDGAYDFRFPYATVFTAPTRDVGLSLAGLYARALREDGIAVIELGFDDPDSQFILDVVEAMNCKADTHSSTQGALWDVTYKPEGVRSEATGKSAHSISHSLGEFTWHSDGAFEANPTPFFGFHILHPDKMGGGIFRVLAAEEVANNLSKKTVQTLTTHEYNLRVPDEFYKGQPTVKGTVMRVDVTTGRTHIRYRKDIMHDPPSDDPDACEAIAELNEFLGKPDDVGEAMPEFAFKENAVLLMDNTRFLHSRTDIKDPRRWLRRVRFHGTPQA